MIEKRSIRGFRDGDEGDMVRIHQNSRDKFEIVDIDENFILALSQRPDFRFFIMEIEGNIVGFVGIIFYTSVSRAEIGPIIIDNGFRNSGIGSKLVVDCENFLKTMGIRRVIAKVRCGNNEGINFFKKNGFEQEAVFRRYTKDCDDVVQLVRFL